MTIHRAAKVDYTSVCDVEDPDHDEATEADAKGNCTACGKRVFTEVPT